MQVVEVHQHILCRCRSSSRVIKDRVPDQKARMFDFDNHRLHPHDSRVVERTQIPAAGCSKNRAVVGTSASLHQPGLLADTDAGSLHISENREVVYMPERIKVVPVDLNLCCKAHE